MGVHPWLGKPIVLKATFVMKNKIRYILALLCCFGWTNEIYSQSPNVVVIIADDLGWAQTSSNVLNFNNASDFYETPVIAGLASEGIAFPNAYVNAASCAPTRAAILSGQWASRPTNNIFSVEGLNPDGATTLLVGPNQGLPSGESEIPTSAVTVAELVKAAGYTTAHFGKYQIGGSANNSPTEQGFDFNFGGGRQGSPGSYFATETGGSWSFHARIGPELDIYADPYTATESVALAGNLSLEGTAKHVSDALADAAIDFLDSNKQSPFFMHFSNYAVHSPFGEENARPDLFAKYEAKNIANPSQMGHDNLGQAAILEGMDQSIGRIADYLKTTPDPRNPGNMLAANTLVYFISDNGGTNGPEDNFPLKGRKSFYSEGGIRSLTFAWSQGLLANMGTVNTTPIVAFDLYPTIVEMTGGTLPANYEVDGVSQWSMLNGSNPMLDRDALYWHFPGYSSNRANAQKPVSIIRKGQYKLIYYYESASYELYDLDSDIGESNNLLTPSSDDATLIIANELSLCLVTHLIDTNAPLLTYRSNGLTVPLPEVIEAPLLRLRSKIFLSGSFESSTGKMRTDLNSKGYLPLYQPYLGNPAQSVDADFFTNNPDIVDWIWLELRTGTAASTAVYRESFLLRNDGWLVKPNEGIDLRLTDLPSGDYYVVIGHRNHLSVMSKIPRPLDSQTFNDLDLSNIEEIFSINALPAELLTGNIYGLWPGDATGNGEVLYSAAGNDRVEVLSVAGGPTPFDFTSGYFSEDINLDGFVKYTGANNDRVEILLSTGGPSAFDSRQVQVPE